MAAGYHSLDCGSSRDEGIGIGPRPQTPNMLTFMPSGGLFAAQQAREYGAQGLERFVLADAGQS